MRINCVPETVSLADVQAVLASDTPPPALLREMHRVLAIAQRVGPNPT